MTNEARQLQLMRDVLRFAPDEHQREARHRLLLLMTDVRSEATYEAIKAYRKGFDYITSATTRVSE